MKILHWGRRLWDEWRWYRALRPTVSLRKRPKAVKHDTSDAAYLAHADTMHEMAAELAETAPIEVVPQKLNGGHGALLWDTAEYPVVLVSIDKRPGESEQHAAASAARRAERERKARLRTDELGEWDPSEVDWSAPAVLFEATALERLTSLGRLANGDDRLAVAGGIASYVLLGAE